MEPATPVEAGSPWLGFSEVSSEAAPVSALDKKRLLQEEIAVLKESGVLNEATHQKKSGQDWTILLDGVLAFLIPFLVGTAVLGFLLTSPPTELGLNAWFRGRSYLFRKEVERAGAVEGTWRLPMEVRIAGYLGNRLEEMQSGSFDALLQARGIDRSDVERLLQFGEEITERGKELDNLFVDYQRRHPEVLRDVHTPESRDLQTQAAKFALETALVAGSLDALSFRAAYELNSRNKRKTGEKQFREVMQALLEAAEEGPEVLADVPSFKFLGAALWSEVLLQNSRFMTQRIKPMLRTQLDYESVSQTAAAQTFEEAVEAFRKSIIASGGREYDLNAAKRCLFIGWEKVTRAPGQVYKASTEVAHAIFEDAHGVYSPGFASPLDKSKALKVLSSVAGAFKESAAEAARAEELLSCKDLPQGTGKDLCSAMSIFFRMF